MTLLRSLSGRLLIVTIMVVMLAEVAIFVPSVAEFRRAYLLERVHRAEIAALTVLAAPGGLVSQDLQDVLIERAEVLNIVVKRDGFREMVLSGPDIAPLTATYDLRDPPFTGLVRDALLRIIDTGSGVIRVIAYAPADMGTEMEITLASDPLARAMRAYGLKILWLSLAISLATAAMVFFAVRRAVVRPMIDVISNVKRFSENPEDARRIIEPKSRVGEIADAERALAEMQRDVRAALTARSRLASLGEAVAKISHDLRNILGTTQLMADRLEMSHDPIVARTAPKLIASLDRAIRLCQSTLTYGRAEETPPEPRAVTLGDLIEEVCEGLGLTETGQGVTPEIDVAPDLVVRADPEQLYRVLSNLARNAVQAIQTTGKPGRLRIAAGLGNDGVEISVADTGPGMPAKAVEHLFQPFRGATRPGGTGLGLAIARELIRANGGELSLVASTTSGTEFRITLPASTTAAAA